MANQSVALGVRFFFGYDLLALVAPTAAAAATAEAEAEAKAQPTVLKFVNGETVAASSVLLNLPVYPLNKLLRASPSLQPHLEASGFGGAFLRVPHGECVLTSDALGQRDIRTHCHDNAIF